MPEIEEKKAEPVVEVKEENTSTEPAKTANKKLPSRKLAKAKAKSEKKSK